MEVTFVKLLWTFGVSLAGFASVEGYGGVGAGSGSFSSSSSTSFSGSAGAGGGLLGGLFGGEGKLGLGNLQFSASLGGKDGGLLGGLFGVGGGGNFGFGGFGGGSIDGSKDGYGESSVTFGGSGQGSSNAGIQGAGGGYGYGGGNADAGTVRGPKNNYGESVSFGGSWSGGSIDGSKDGYGQSSVAFGGSGQGSSNAGIQGTGGGYGFGGGNMNAGTIRGLKNNYGESVSFGGSGQGRLHAGSNGAGVRASTFDQISGGFYDGAEYDNIRSHPSDATGSSKGAIESGVAGYGERSTGLAEGLRGPSNCDSKIGCSGRGVVYANGGIVVSSNSGQGLAERESKFPNSAQVQGASVFGGDAFVGTGAAKGPGSSFGGLAESGSVSGSANLGSGGSGSRGVYGNQHIESGSGLSSGQVGSFVQSGISSGASVSVNGKNKEKAVERNVGGGHVGAGSHSSTVSEGGVGGLQFGAGIAAERDKGPKPSIENVFLQGNGKGPSVSSDFQVSGTGVFDAEPKPCSGSSCTYGRDNGGEKVQSSAVSGGGVGGLQFGASIAAEIDKGPKPLIESVFFQGHGKGPSVSSDFQVSGTGVFDAEPKPCSGSSCTYGRDNGGGKVQSSGVSGGGVGGVQFGAGIAAEIDKGPKPSIENVSLQGNGKGPSVSSDFQVSGTGVFDAEPKSCSGSSCTYGRDNGGGKVQSSSVSGGGVGGLQFGAGIAAEIDKGPKPSIENVFLQGNGKGPSVSSDFQVSGTGVFNAEPKSCSGSSCTYGRDNGDGKGQSSGGVGGLQFEAGIAAEIDKGAKPSIENVFLQGNGKGPLVSSDFQVSGTGVFDAEPKPCSGSSCTYGRDNGGGKVQSSAVSGGGVGGLQFGAGIIAEIDKGPKPSIENVFLQGNGKGPSVSSDFQVSGTGVFDAEPKPCSGSSCTYGRDNGGGKVQSSGVSGGGVGGVQFGAGIAAEIDKGPKPSIENVFLQGNGKGPSVSSDFQVSGTGVFDAEPKSCSGSSCTYGRDNGGGKVQSSSVSGGGVGGLQFGAGIAAEIDKGPKPSIENVFLQGNGKGPSVSSDFQVSGTGVFDAEPKSCSGSSCTYGRDNGGGKGQSSGGVGGLQFGAGIAAEIDKGAKPSIENVFLQGNGKGPSVSSDFQVSGTGVFDAEPKPCSGSSCTYGRDNGGGKVQSSGVSGGGVGGVQFGAGIAAEIDKGAKPLIENVFFQGHGKGPSVSSDFQVSGSGDFATEPKPCRGSSCSHEWGNGSGKVKNIAAGGIAGSSSESFSGSGNFDVRKSIEGEGGIIFGGGIGGADSSYGRGHGHKHHNHGHGNRHKPHNRGHGNGHRHNNHGHDKKQTVIASGDVDSSLYGFDERSSANSDSNVEFDLSIGSAANTGKGHLGIFASGGVDGIVGSSYGAGVGGSQSGGFVGGSKPCGGYGCAGQDDSEKTIPFGNIGAGASSFASASSGAGSFGYGR